MTTTHETSPSPRPRSGCWRGCLGCGSVAALLFVTVLAGLFFWLRGRDIDLLALVARSVQGDLDQDTLMVEMIRSMGTGQISAFNLTDQEAWIRINNVGEQYEGGQNTALPHVMPYDLQSVVKLPGLYETIFYLDFDPFGGDNPVLASCTFDLTRDAEYQFFILPERVLLQVAGDPVPAEFDVTRSPYCEQGAVTP